MPYLSVGGLSFSGLVWTFKLLPSKHTYQYIAYLAILQYILQTSVWFQRTIKVKEC